MAGPTVVVSVLADTKNLTKGLNDIGGETSKLGGLLKGVGVGVGVALAAAGAAAVGFLATSIAAAAESQKVTAQTAAVLASTQGIAGQTSASIEKLTGSLSKMSGVDDEVVAAGANILLTFTNIRGANFDAATKSALNLSVALGKDMASASTLVGKALNDPIAGIGALSKAGVQFSDDQKAVIAAMVETGDIAGAQALILGELETQFGGSAEAFGNTLLGTFGKVKTSFGNIQEIIGGAFLPVATAALSGVNDLLTGLAENPAFTTIVNKVGEFLTTLLSGGAATDSFAQAFSVISAVLNPFGIILQALLPVLPQLGDSLMALGQALGGAFLAILPTLSNLLQTLVGVLSGVLAAILPVIIGLVTQLAGIFTQLMPTLVPIVELIGGILAEAFVKLGPVIELVATTLGGILSTALTALAPILQVAAELILTLLTALMPIIDVVLQLVTAFAPLFGVFGELLGALLPPLIDLLLVLLEPILALVGPLVELLTPALQLVAWVLGIVADALSVAIDWIVDLVTGSGDAGDQLADIWNNTAGMFADFFSNTGGMISDFISNTIGMFADFGTNLANGVSMLWQNVSRFFSDGINGIINFFGGLPGQVMAAIGNLGGILFSAGQDMIQGLIDGAGSLLSNIGSFFLDIVPDFIKGPFKAALGIASPSKVFKGFGVNILTGLTDGLSQLGGLGRAMDSLSNVVTRGFNPDVSLPGSYNGYGFGARVYNLDVHTLIPTAETGRAVVDSIEEFDRLNGKRAA